MQPSGLDEAAVKLDLEVLFAHASWPVRATLIVLAVASTLVWLVGVLKVLQLARLRSAEGRFERRAHNATSGTDLHSAARGNDASAGSRIVAVLRSRGTGASVERLRAAADQAIARERQRARALMAVLGSIGAASPFVGLFGTVYGIMDAFVRIGAAKSASLPIVAPAIGEALISTAIGLAAAIPAVLFYNFADKQIGDFIAALEASAAEWVVVFAESGASLRANAPAELPSATEARGHEAEASMSHRFPTVMNPGPQEPRR